MISLLKKMPFPKQANRFKVSGNCRKTWNIQKYNPIKTSLWIYFGRFSNSIVLASCRSNLAKVWLLFKNYIIKIVICCSSIGNALNFTNIARLLQSFCCRVVPVTWERWIFMVYTKTLYCTMFLQTAPSHCLVSKKLLCPSSHLLSL